MTSLSCLLEDRILTRQNFSAQPGWGLAGPAREHLTETIIITLQEVRSLEQQAYVILSWTGPDAMPALCGQNKGNLEVQAAVMVFPVKFLEALVHLVGRLACHLLHTRDRALCLHTPQSLFTFLLNFLIFCGDSDFRA